MISGRPSTATLPACLGAALLLAACQDRNGTATEGGDPRREEAPLLEQEATDAEPDRQTPAGTFRARVSEETTAPPEGRLPAPGDRSAHIAATELFPGGGRVHAPMENPYSGDLAAIAAGERYFEAFNCAGCHAPLGGGGMGPPLSDGNWIYGGEPAQIYMSILHGRPQGMPAWSTMLPQRAIWEMVAYIETLPDIEDYAAEKGFTRASARARQGETAGEPGTDDTPPRQ